MIENQEVVYCDYDNALIPSGQAHLEVRGAIVGASEPSPPISLEFCCLDHAVAYFEEKITDSPDLIKVRA